MSMAAIDTEARTLRMERDFRAPPEAVFDAFTDPAQAVKWWGPHGMEVPEIELNAHEGGPWRTAMVGADGVRYTVVGTYKVVERPNRLVYTWRWTEGAEMDEDTTVDLTFTKIEGGTRLSLVHSLFDSEANRDDHGEGWGSTFDCLAEFLAH